jgi:hypothetical protein
VLVSEIMDFFAGYVNGEIEVGVESEEITAVLGTASQA